MRWRTAACSSMMLLVIGTFRALTTSASSRSTRNCMSTSPSRSRPSVPQEHDVLFANLLHAERDRLPRQDRGMFAEEPRDDQRVGREGGAKTRMPERRRETADIGERRGRGRGRGRGCRGRGREGGGEGKRGEIGGRRVT